MRAHAWPKVAFFSTVSRAPADRVVVGMLSQLRARDRNRFFDRISAFIPARNRLDVNEFLLSFSPVSFGKKCLFHP